MTDMTIPRVAALASVALALAGCVNLRINDHARYVEARYLGAPAAQALQELGPARDRPVADLRHYTWDTGSDLGLGGSCRLTLVSDARGTVVDYRIEGTPLGCQRLLRLS